MKGHKRILIVDDDPLASEAVARPLLAAGYDVVTLDSGAAALDWLRERTADLVILDVVMPGLSGFDVCRRLRQSHETRLTPVVFLTSRNRVRDLKEGASAGSDLYLFKPVLTAKLLTMAGLFASREVPFVEPLTAPAPSI